MSARGVTRVGGGRDRASEAGFALISVVLFSAVALGLLAMGYERIHQATLLAKESSGNALASPGAAEALGTGLALLQTGAPPAASFRCRLVVHGREAANAYEIAYNRLGSSECGVPGGACWSVEATPWTETSAFAGDCPSSFTTNCAGGLP
jgi:hypothetical protein